MVTMLTCIILIILWVLYTVAIIKFMLYICGLPATPLFDLNSIGIWAGFVIASTGWIGFSIFVASFLTKLQS